MPNITMAGSYVEVIIPSGTALSNVITISGSTKNIIGSPNATINSDYGSFTLVWTGQNSVGWSSIAMNN